MNTHSKLIQSIAGLAVITGFLLLIPLIAMQFTDEVIWTLSDFIVAGSLLYGTGFAYILVTRILAPQMGGNKFYRIAVGFALFTGLFLIWANLAVGIIGSENNAFNLIYFGVIAFGVIGAFIARFQPLGMTRVMFSLVAAHAVVAVIALFTGMAEVPGSSVFEIIAVNGLFIFMFTISALLFRYAEQNHHVVNTVPEQ